MQKCELNPQQQRDLNVFNLILEHRGWTDTQETELRLDLGESVNPEGYRVLHTKQAVLQARFHAPVNMISLRILDFQYEDKVQFHFLFDEKPERILEWMAQVGEELSIANYPELLKMANGKCEMILLEVSESEIYEVKPPTNA